MKKIAILLILIIIGLGIFVTYNQVENRRNAAKVSTETSNVNENGTQVQQTGYFIPFFNKQVDWGGTPPPYRSPCYPLWEALMDAGVEVNAAMFSLKTIKANPASTANQIRLAEKRLKEANTAWQKAKILYQDCRKNPPTSTAPAR